MIVFISGGARSGKSHYAEQLALAAAQGSTIAYIATGEAVDSEFRQRILHHQERRGPAFTTIEEAHAIDGAVATALTNHSVLILECITTWLGNLFHHGLTAASAPATSADRLSESAALAAIEQSASLCIDRLINQAAGYPQSHLIIVSNEIGLGLVPPDAMSRAYRDTHGRINRQLASAADQAWLVVSGLPLKLK